MSSRESGRNGKRRGKRVRVVSSTGQTPINGCGFSIYDSASDYIAAEKQQISEEGVPDLIRSLKQN